MTELIILASASPRRSQLLTMLGVSFHVDVSAVDEDLDVAQDAAARAKELALAKARAVVTRHGQHIVLAADTLISFRGRLLGKPRDADEAVSMLKALRGKWHRVITGLAVINGNTGCELTSAEVTRVLIRRYSDDEISAYVASGDPMDKAAAYAVQNASFHPVERLDVCYSNVMGLPLCATRELLTTAGLDKLQHGEGERTRQCAWCRMAQ